MEESATNVQHVFKIKFLLTVIATVLASSNVVHAGGLISEEIFSAIGSYKFGQDITDKVRFNIHPQRKLYLNPTTPPTYTIEDDMTLAFTANFPVGAALTVGADLDFWIANYRQRLDWQSADQVPTSDPVALPTEDAKPNLEIDKGMSWVENRILQPTAAPTPDPQNPSWDEIISPYRLLFHIPWKATDLLSPSFAEDDILSYTTYGRAFVGPGIDIDQHIEVSATAQVYLDGYFRITLMKQKDQIVKMKVQYYGEDGTCVQADLRGHVLIHVGSIFKNGKDISHNFFDLYASAAQMRMLESVWVLDLKDPAGQAAFDAAVRGSMQNLDDLETLAPQAVHSEYKFHMAGTISSWAFDFDIGIYEFRKNQTRVSGHSEFDLTGSSQPLYLSQDTLQDFRKVGGVFKNILQRETFYVETQTWTDQDYAQAINPEIKIFEDISIEQDSPTKSDGLRNRAVQLLGAQYEAVFDSTQMREVQATLLLGNAAVTHILQVISNVDTLWSFLSDQLAFTDPSGHVMSLATSVDRKKIQDMLNQQDANPTSDGLPYMCKIATQSEEVDCADYYSDVADLVASTGDLAKLKTDTDRLKGITQIFEKETFRLLFGHYLSALTINDPREVSAQVYFASGPPKILHDGAIDPFYPQILEDHYWGGPVPCNNGDGTCINIY